MTQREKLDRFHKNNEQFLQTREEKMSSRKQETLEKSFEQCTFQPNLISKSSSRNIKGDFLSRTQTFMDRVEKNKEKTYKHVMATQCSFKPHILSHKTKFVPFDQRINMNFNRSGKLNFTQSRLKLDLNGRKANMDLTGVQYKHEREDTPEFTLGHASVESSELKKSNPKFSDEPKQSYPAPATFEILNNVESDMFDSTEGHDEQMSPALRDKTTGSKGSSKRKQADQNSGKFSMQITLDSGRKSEEVPESEAQAGIKISNQSLKKQRTRRTTTKKKKKVKWPDLQKIL